MRIRRRPQAQAQAQALIPSPPQQASDPSTAPPNAPTDQHHWPLPLPADEAEEGRKKNRPEEELRLHRPRPSVADLPSSAALPQGGNVVGRSESHQPGRGVGAQRQGADGNGSLENGHRNEREWPATNAAGQRLANGLVSAAPAPSPTAAVHEKEAGVKSDGPKRRRGPAVLLEGSRCSRVNGRGWRCSQPTLVGYALCEHHLGKGRQCRSASGGRSTGGPKLGRTEPASSRKIAAAALAVVTVAGATDANEPPIVQHI